MTRQEGSQRLHWIAVVVLIFILLGQLAFSIRRESQTWDEACHIIAGYLSWKNLDFGVNPEHPPLVKFVATAPLLPLSLHTPVPQGRNFKVDAFLDGRAFLYSNDADMILFRTRMAASLFTVLLALLVFLAAREMFGNMAAFLALILMVFEPSMLAHGALVTTDMGIACCIFAAVYAFYRYVKRPSRWRLVIVGIATGAALAAKHSGILLFPILILLILGEAILEGLQPHPAPPGNGSTAIPFAARHALRQLGALIAVGAISFVLLWAAYGFRYSARPGNQPMRPSLTDYAQDLSRPIEKWSILSAARWRLVPESYLFGLVDVRVVADNTSSYLFGKAYAHGLWYYFPIAFLIKSSLTLLVLLAIALGMIALGRVERWREVLFLVIPPAFYFVVAMTSRLNIGIRHILPIYPFLFILAGWAAARLITRQRPWGYVVAALLLFNALSSARSFPVYLAYSNELWGGPNKTYRLLTDSNADWGQQLKSTKKYLDQRGVRECWFAYFAAVVSQPEYYGIPCKPLTTIASVWLHPEMVVPATIDGPVLISAGTLSGYEFGQHELNPYDQFQHIRPVAQIDAGIFVFEGHFEIPLAAALNHVTRASEFQKSRKLDEALAEAQAAVSLAPNSVSTQEKLGRILIDLHRPDEARVAFRKALTIAKTIQPDRQKGWVPGLEAALANL